MTPSKRSFAISNFSLLSEYRLDLNSIECIILGRKKNYNNFVQRGLPCCMCHHHCHQPSPASLHSSMSPSIQSTSVLAQTNLLTSSRRTNGRMHVLADTATQRNPFAWALRVPRPRRHVRRRLRLRCVRERTGILQSVASAAWCRRNSLRRK